MRPYLGAKSRLKVNMLKYVYPILSVVDFLTNPLFQVYLEATACFPFIVASTFAKGDAKSTG
jgi:hypothetical protein